MRPYAPHPRIAGAYQVPASPAPLQRPNRNAAGMSAAFARKKRRLRWSPAHTLTLIEPTLAGDVLALTVRGTLDPLGASRFDLERVPCPCCGARSDKLRLRADVRRMRKSRRLASKALRLNPSRLP